MDRLFLRPAPCTSSLSDFRPPNYVGGNTYSKTWYQIKGHYSPNIHAIKDTFWDTNWYYYIISAGHSLYIGQNHWNQSVLNRGSWLYNCMVSLAISSACFTFFLDCCCEGTYCYLLQLPTAAREEPRKQLQQLVLPREEESNCYFILQANCLGRPPSLPLFPWRNCFVVLWNYWTTSILALLAFLIFLHWNNNYY